MAGRRPKLPSPAQPRQLAIAAALLVVTAAAEAGPVVEHVASGDRDHAAGALVEYQAAIAAAPNDHAALLRAARAAVELAEFDEDGDRRKELLAESEDYARRAVAANPHDAEGHFLLAWTLGRRAQTLARWKRAPYGAQVRSHALEALQLDPGHAGALHVMAMWQAEIMRLGSIDRFFARRLLGAAVVDSASWDGAVHDLERAVAAQPDRLGPRFDLGALYLEVGETTKARAEFQRMVDAPPRELNDVWYKCEAARALAGLGDRPGSLDGGCPR